MRRAFTLIELLVVIAILVILAALLFPVFTRAKGAAKAADCLSNIRQVGVASSLYLADFDGTYPQTKMSTPRPEVDDADGGYEEPDYGSVFERLAPYEGKNARLFCDEDPDPEGKACANANPDAPPVNSYLINGFFVFGLKEAEVSKVAETILFAERRGETSAPYCDTLYRPWWNPTNPTAPENDMAEEGGAIATHRHTKPNFAFADSHAKPLAWTQTLNPIDLHQVRR